MKEIIVKIPDENCDLATQLLEKLGAEIEEKKKKVKRKEKISEKISPTYLFGKWKNFDIDAKKLREEAWDRSQKYL